MKLSLNSGAAKDCWRLHKYEELLFWLWACVLFPSPVCRRTVPYGMSSYRGSQRVRRSSSAAVTEPRRCICTDCNDTQCHHLCGTRRDRPRNSRAGNLRDLLNSLYYHEVSHVLTYMLWIKMKNVSRQTQMGYLEDEASRLSPLWALVTSEMGLQGGLACCAPLGSRVWGQLSAGNVLKEKSGALSTLKLGPEPWIWLLDDLRIVVISSGPNYVGKEVAPKIYICLFHWAPVLTSVETFSWNPLLIASPPLDMFTAEKNSTWNEQEKSYKGWSCRLQAS